MSQHALAYKLNYAWRVVATGVGFSLFGLGGLLLGLLSIPLVLLTPQRDANLRGEKIRGYISWLFRLFIKFITAIGVLDYRINNPAELDRAQLIVANHPTLLDVVFLVSFVPNAICVVKDSLFKNLCVGFVIRHAGYVSNKDPQASIEACAQAIQRGATVIIFPEGTRTTPGQRSRLHRGAAYVALQAKVPLSPIHISCEPSALTKAEKWYEIPPRKMQFVFTVDDRIEQAQNLDTESRTSASRSVTQQINQALFMEEAHATSK